MKEVCHIFNLVNGINYINISFVRSQLNKYDKKLNVRVCYSEMNEIRFKYINDGILYLVAEIMHFLNKDFLMKEKSNQLCL